MNGNGDEGNARAEGPAVRAEGGESGGLPPGIVRDALVVLLDVARRELREGEGAERVALGALRVAGDFGQPLKRPLHPLVERFVWQQIIRP